MTLRTGICRGCGGPGLVFADGYCGHACYAMDNMETSEEQ